MEKVLNLDEKMISNSFDYSNIVPTINEIIPIMQYCDSLYKNFLELARKDEEENEKYKHEYRFYKYKKTFDSTYSIQLIDNNYKSIDLLYQNKSMLDMIHMKVQVYTKMMLKDI